MTLFFFRISIIFVVLQLTSISPHTYTGPTSTTSTTGPTSTTSTTSTANETTATYKLPTDDVKDRERRSHQNQSSARRPRTGDTILNIRGAVRDSIGEAGAAHSARHATRLDTFLIRPAAPELATQHHDPDPGPPAEQVATGRQIVAKPHSTVELACHLHNLANVTWYKDGERVFPTITERGAARVRAERGQAGVWTCRGTEGDSAPVTLLLYERVSGVYLRVDGRRLAGDTWVPVRDRAPLEVSCVAEGGVPAPTLRWHLTAVATVASGQLDQRSYLTRATTNYSTVDLYSTVNETKLTNEGVCWSRTVVSATRELHNATLACTAEQQTDVETDDPPTAKLEIRVTYPPSFVISRWPGFGVSLQAGAAAALRCDVDSNPPSRAWWQRDGHLPTSSPPPLESRPAAPSSEATLRWPSLSPSHAGWYRCRATWGDLDYSSIGYYLNVIASDEGTERERAYNVSEPAASTSDERGGHRAGQRDAQRVDVPVGGTVKLHCPAGSTGCWWRRATTDSAWRAAGGGATNGRGGELVIQRAVYQEAGEYRCMGSSGGAGVRELKRTLVNVSGGPTAVAVSSTASGGGWRLECGVCGAGGRATLSVRWSLPTRRWSPAAPLVPGDHPHCYSTQLQVFTPDEVWCVVTQIQGGGAVAVFPPRGPPPPAPPPRALPAARAPPAPLVAPLLALCFWISALI